jgi:hypothetical protein
MQSEYRSCGLSRYGRLLQLRFFRLTHVALLLMALSLSNVFAVQVHSVLNAVNDADGTMLGAVSSDTWQTAGLLYSTATAPAVYGNYRFAYWSNNRSPAEPYRDAWGRSLNPVSFYLMEDTTLTAHYLPATCDTDGDGVPDWYEIEYLGSLTNNAAYDGDGDGITLLVEYTGGTHPLYANTNQAGGVVYADSALVTCNLAGYARYTLRSVPSGTVDQTATVSTNTVITTPSLAGNTSFGYWMLDGVRQLDAWGVAYPQVSFTVQSNDVECVAYLFAGDTDSDGVADAYEQYYYGTLTNNAASDNDGDGITLLAEKSAGTNPLHANTNQPGGVFWADSALVTCNLAGYSRYVLRSVPAGTVDQSATVPTGTLITTPSMEQSTFGYWALDGVRQADAWGVSLRQISFAVSNVNREAVAYLYSSDSDGDGVNDGYEYYYTGSLTNGVASDSDGDGRTLVQEYTSGSNPLFAESSVEGGVFWQDSSLVTVNLQLFDRGEYVLLAGAQARLFSPWPMNATGTCLGANSAPALGDWDGDGDIELFVGGSNGTLRVYENAGSPVVPNLVERTTNFVALAGLWAQAGSVAPALGDWSGDGRDDLVVGGDTGVVWLVRSGTNAWGESEFAEMGNAQRSTFNAQLSTGSTVALDGGRSVCAKTILGAGRTMPAFGDMNGDGRVDLLVLTDNGIVQVYTNSANPELPFADTPATADLLGTVVPEATGLAVADIDEDNDLDVLVSDNAGRIWAFKNDGAGTYALSSKVFGGTYAGFAHRLTVAAADFDGDGDTDVIGGFAEGGLVYLRNPSARLQIRTPSATVLAGGPLALAALNASGPVAWHLRRNGSGGTVVSNTGAYAAGPLGGGIDCVEGVAGNGLRGLAYVNVMSPADIARSGKAVVIAGRASSTDPVWPTTSYLANYGYNTLRYRGYGRENMRYLSPVTGTDVDGDGLANDIAALSTRTNVAATFTNWVGNADKLFVYLVDHGGVAEGQGFFRLSPSETISASELNLWLTALQNRWGTEVTLVIDCCNSGSFVPWLAYPGPAKRVVITACGADEPTIFVAGGLVSFSEAFFSGLMLGLSAGDAFVSAKEAMSTYQGALLDDTGDGVVNGADGTYADGLTVGASFVAGKDAPQIGDVAGNQQLSGDTVATLWADGVASAYPVARVWCQVVPPGYRPDPANPVIDLPQLELAYNAGTMRYEAQYAGFSEEGTYKVVYYAKDIWDSVSLPRQSYVFQSGFLERAVVVAGGSTSDPRWPCVENIADYARDVFVQRRLSTNAVYYMSQALTDHVDALATRAELMNVITNWAKGSSKLTLYMVAASVGTAGAFRLNETETVSAAEIDGLLDSYQISNATVSVIMDFDGSGGWLPSLQGAGRICIASTAANRQATFLNFGLVSFSWCFFANVFNGINVWESFDSASDMIFRPSGKKQKPLLDSTSDGQYVSKIDQVVARTWYLGSAFMTGADSPTVDAVTPDTVLTKTGSLTLWAAGVADIGGISNVFCLVTGPEYDGLSDIPETELAWNSETERYEVNYGGFTNAGEYACAYYVRDSEGLLSIPLQTLVLVAPADAYEPDDTSAQAGIFEVGASQLHNLHLSNDVDWVKFYAPSGFVFNIEATQIGTNADVRLDVYHQSPTGSLDLIWESDEDPSGEGLGEHVYLDLQGEYQDPAGYYYIRIKSSDGVALYGPGSEYELVIYSAQGGGSLIVVAVDKLNGAKPPAGAVVEWDGTNSRPFGAANSLLLDLAEGIHTVRVTTAAGYLPEEDPAVQEQVANSSSYWYGNPKKSLAAAGVPRMAVFQFVPVTKAEGRVINRHTGEPVAGASLAFKAVGGLLSGLTYDGYPNSAAYKSPWVTAADGAFPTNVWLPTAGWDLTVSRETYTNLVRAPAVALSPAGSVTNLGTLLISPIDINANGIADAWELHFGLAGVTSSSNSDTDIFTDKQEYLAGTDPTNSLSYFRIIEVRESSSHEHGFRWNGAGSRSYRIFWSDYLGGWNQEKSVLTEGVNEWYDSAEPKPASRFYKVEIEIPEQ